MRRRSDGIFARLKIWVKPQGITNRRLQNAADALYQARDLHPGGTAGAVLYTKATGLLVRGSNHLAKAQERASQLMRILNQEPLSASERQIAQDMLDDLLYALNQ